MSTLPTNLIRRKDRPGYWYRGVVDGKVRQLSLGTDYQAALRRLRSLKTDGPPRSDATVRDAAAQWLASYIATSRGERDQRLAAQRVRDYVEPRLGRLLLSKLTADHLRGYRLWLERSHLSVQSVRHLLSDLRCMLNWCEDVGLLERSPVPRRLLPKIQERPPDRLTDEEVAAVCAVQDPYGFICRLLVQTGLRWGEAVRAQAADIQGGLLVVHKTKSGKVRRIPLTRELQHELGNRVGRLVPLTNATGLTRQVRRHSGVEGFHPHQLRHAFACRWLEAGGSLAALQELLGHSSIVTTQRYGRLGEAHVRDEVERIGERLSPGVSPGVGPSGCVKRSNLL